MYNSSIISRASMLSAMKDSIQASRPTVKIKLCDEKPATWYGGPPTFTTMDRIEGEVTILAPTDTRFDEIQISFEGSERVWMEKFGTASAAANRVQVSRTVSDSLRESPSENARTPFLTARQFLRLHQPVDELAMPIPRIFEKGRTYKFPFVFVVPEQLLPTICSHRYKNNLVQEAHLRLPPSLGGDTNIATVGSSFDDLAPDMTRISYSLSMRVLKKRDSDGKGVLIAESHRKVRIIPSYEDLPPVAVDDNDKDYVLRKEKNVRKGFLKGKLGRLAVEAQEPKALHVAAIPNARTPTTMIPVTVTFTPAAANCNPPSLSSLQARLRSVTTYSTQPVTYFPTKSSVVTDPTLGVYDEASLLSSRCLANVQWTKNDSPAGSFYTANIQIPVVQPKCKNLVPTFYSCLAARTYAVEFTLSVNASGTLGSHSSIRLKVPLQVSCRPTSWSTSPVTERDLIQETQSSPDYGDAGDDSYVADFFRPRSNATSPAMEMSTHLPGLQLSPRTGILQQELTPPGYTHIAGGVSARIFNIV